MELKQATYTYREMLRLACNTGEVRIDLTMQRLIEMLHPT